MPRDIPTTTWGGRSPPTTAWTVPRNEICITWDQVSTTWDSETRTWDEMCGRLTTVFDNPRYNLGVEDMTGANIDDLLGNPVEGLSGTETNILDTTWI